MLAATAMTHAAPAEPSDPLLNLMIKKGILTQQEAEQVMAESQANQTNNAVFPESKWKISDAIKSVELFGDIRFRYENRSAQAPGGGGIILNRYRAAVRVGLRGEVADNFYYGLRLETAANPRSPWVTLGSSASGTPYQGPFGKSNAGINFGQAYIGWKPEDWVDITIGKMPNPLCTTPMVWDTDLNPEGLAERFKYTVGPADFFATFGQFIYQDTNPNSASTGLLPSSFPSGNSSSPAFMLAWQTGFIYHFDHDISVKAAATVYNYTSHGENVATNSSTLSPGFADTFVGQGAAKGATYGGVAAPPGFSGFPIGSANGFNYDGFAANQTGINDLLVLELPAEVNFKIARFNARIFGDYAYNLEGNNRAANAFAAAAALGAANVAPITSIASDQVKAYQIGFAIGNRDSLGLVYGGKAKKGFWEARAYWQHIEQYALDPNLLDSDFFEGRGNLEGIYSAFAYSFADNMIGTLRYGYASPIDRNLGTGGSNQDIPQVNQINKYQLIQLDLTYRF